MGVSSSKTWFNKEVSRPLRWEWSSAQIHLQGHQMIAHAWSQSEDCRVEGKCKMLAWTKENCSPKQARPRTRFCAPSTWLTWKIKLKKSKNHSAWMLYFTKPTKFNSWKIPTKLNDEVYKYCSRQLVLWISDECKVLCKWFHDLIKRSMESSLPLKMVNQVQPWKRTPKINLSHETKVAFYLLILSGTST